MSNRSSLALFVLLATTAVVGGCRASTSDLDGTQVAAVGHGQHETPIDAVASLSIVDARTLRYAYSTGGGCADHTPSAKASFVASRFGLAARVAVSDVTDQADPCEALLHLDGQADLAALLATEAAASKPDAKGRTVDVTLPSIAIEVGSPTGRSAPAAGVDVGVLSALDVDSAGTLRFGYVVGGGCGTHTASTAIELVPPDDGEGSYRARVIVSDVSAAPDPCESMVAVEGVADLRALLADEAARAGVDLAGMRVATELPPVSVVVPWEP